MELQLKVLIGSSVGQVIKVAGPQFLIGRAEDCQLRPRSDLISRHHCALIVDGRYVAIRDFGSKNGTYLNNERVSGERELDPGDKLKIGPLEFEVVLDESLAGKKRPKVHSIKEAAARTAETSDPKAHCSDGDLDQWLSDESVDGGETRELRTTDTIDISTLDTHTSSPAPPPPEETPKPPHQPPPGKMAPAKAGNSESAAADMLKKLRKYR